jgi:hypothetical protein
LASLNATSGNTMTYGESATYGDDVIGRQGFDKG